MLFVNKQPSLRQSISTHFFELCATKKMEEQPHQQRLFGMAGFLEEQGVAADEMEEDDSSSSSSSDSSEDEDEGSIAANLPPPQMSKEQEAALAALTAPEGDMQAFLATISQKAALGMRDDSTAIEDNIEEEDILPFYEAEKG